VVERGDRVKVRCLVGGIVIALKAEARADGAEGDTIELRKLGERSTFLATVTGRGEAIVDLASSSP
jgi:flagella basal body P-ring formation protein FlgA